ncbi:hypothetical protein OGH69_12965 [Flavobacterium sp. MFBS3-15]|uniref:hypothetical protein n=1 Tax=Flavobacterium sp. MFBS3-15 TaxID=2989816 RepID=UPI0022365C8E|nr:hypothetical protein [Flavobacterium sp. MFBS3-15]MCW4469884.1 hypothetical protein [Flavobacterium sp. MFBS3-15]
MKKITLLVAGLLMSGSLALASESTLFSGRPTHYAIDYREAEPVVFMERGVEFLVFPNGEFDFNTEPSTRPSDTYYRYGRGRYNTNATYGAPNRGGGVRIEHDYAGRVRRVGNVFINYDARGRVKRIGTVYMSYNSFALAQIGNLRLIYNRSGQIVDATGYVNAYNRGAYEPYYSGTQGSGNYGGGSTGGSHYDDDSDVYYRKPAETTRG